MAQFVIKLLDKQGDEWDNEPDGEGGLRGEELVYLGWEIINRF